MSFFSGLLSALPGAVAQGLIWGLMAIGVFITFKVLDLADLTVDGTMATGGAVLHRYDDARRECIGWQCCALFLAGMLAGLCHRYFCTPVWVSRRFWPVFLTQLALFSINLRIMDKKSKCSDQSGQLQAACFRCATLRR